MPSKAPVKGLIPPAAVNVDLLEELVDEVDAQVEREIERLKRDEHLLRSMHTFYGPRRARAPGDLTRVSLTNFAEILRVL